MSKKEIQTLRRPFLKELFRNNKFNLTMTVIAALFGAAAELVISWLIKEVADLISGECPYGFGTLLIAHISFNIPYVILSVGPKLRQMDRNLIDAAQDLGCTWMQAFWKVVIPEIKPGIVSGALTAFTMSIDDFVISHYVSGGFTTLPLLIYNMTKKRVTPEMYAVCTCIFLSVLVLLLIMNISQIKQTKNKNTNN